MYLSDSLVRDIRVGDKVCLLPEFITYTPNEKGGPVHITEVIEPKGRVSEFRYRFIDETYDKYNGGTLLMTTEPIDVLATNQLFIAESSKSPVLSKPTLPHL